MITAEPGAMENIDIRPRVRHKNAFGFLRLLFASLVIVSHVPQFIDGNADREVLFRLTRSMGLGGLAVDGFFLISGYLVVASFRSQPTVADYLIRRLARIVPGFVYACLICIFIVAPLSGVSFETISANREYLLATTLSLRAPELPGAFEGTHYAALNGAMWTIAHEFRCYILVILLGKLGAFRFRTSIPAIALFLFFVTAILQGGLDFPGIRDWLLSVSPLSDLDKALRLTGVFLVGSTFQLFRDRIVYRRSGALAAAAALLPLICVPALSEPAFAVLGGYIIFTLGFGVTGGPLTRINNTNDISYGVYLYGWPVGKLLLWTWPQMPMVPCMTANIAIAGLLGWLSWHLIEKRALALVHRGQDPKPGAEINRRLA